MLYLLTAHLSNVNNTINGLCLCLEIYLLIDCCLYIVLLDI